MTSLFSAALSIVAAVVSGTLLRASFPPFDLSFFAWIGLVPLFLAIWGRNARYAFLLSLLCGSVFFLGLFSWILEVPGYSFLHHFLLDAYLCSYFGLFGLAFAFITKRQGMTPALFAAPFVWVSLEYIRSNAFFLALPWGLLAHSQYRHPSVIHIASFTGAYGVSFLIVMVNSAFTAITCTLFHRANRHGKALCKSFAGRGPLGVVVTGVSLILITLVYGRMVMSKPIVGNEVKISVVQGNIEQYKKWDAKYADFIIKTYGDLTSAASTDRPALIVWPETATPGSITRDRLLYHQVSLIARSSGAYLLLGSAKHQKFKREGSKEVRYLNSAFLLPPASAALKSQRYDKILLLPFGEYLPLKRIIPWSYLQVPDVGGYIPGSIFTVFEHPACRFGVTICWENIFPDLVRRFVKRGAQFIVNITNEAWFGRTAAPHQFLSMSVFRAVENRVYVVRSANTGISCFIDPCGRILSRLRDEHGQDIFVRGVLTESIIPLNSATLYTRYGDWFAIFCLPCTVPFLLAACLKKRHSRHL